eukprot:scaffold64356_cov21-Prasinocladus_malaysianus.AAC.1
MKCNSTQRKETKRNEMKWIGLGWNSQIVSDEGQPGAPELLRDLFYQLQEPGVRLLVIGEVAGLRKGG